jgi:hypothetical protein
MYRKCLIVFLSLFLLILSKLAGSLSQTREAHPGLSDCKPSPGAPPAALQCAAP